MRIVVQDFSGHPFQAQLSRALAGRGHDVVHSSCPDYRSGQGRLARRPDDPESLRFEDVGLGRAFDKYRYTRRIRQEVEYGARLVGLVRRERPDVYVSCNEPLLAKAAVGIWCTLTGRRWVFWVQDLYSVAMRREAALLLGRVGAVLGRGFEALERLLLRRADGIVVISPAFDDWLEAHAIHRPDVTLIPNWAPLDEVPYSRDDPGWFEGVGVPAGAPVALYSGTLGRKHDSGLLVAAADRLQASGAHLVVISEGPAADELRAIAAERTNLHVLPFQPWDQMPQILASASVLLAVLAPEASAYSVPSKVLTYLCAGRAIVAAVPADNLAATYLEEAGAGIVVDPDDVDSFVDAIASLLADGTRRRELGDRARAFAEATFDIDRIASAFEEVLSGALARPARQHGARTIAGR